MAKGCLISLCVMLLAVAALIGSCGAIIDAVPPMR